MAYSFFRLESYIPEGCYQKVGDINFQALYAKGKRLLIIDIDNTLIPYDLSEPTPEIITLIKGIQAIGFKVVFMSNNHQDRVAHFSNLLDCFYVASARKPLHYGYRKVMTHYKEIPISAIHAIGDQLMTDVLGANQMGISCSLVKVLKRKSEKWFTKINRRLEHAVLKQMAKDYPLIYQQILSIQE